MSDVVFIRFSAAPVSLKKPVNAAEVQPHVTEMSFPGTTGF